MPYRASTRNPVDFGAAGLSLSKKARLSIVDALLSSAEIDALVFHGYGLKGIEPDIVPEWVKERQKDEEEVLRGSEEMMRAYEKPVIFGCHLSRFESATIRNLARDGIPGRKAPQTVCGDARAEQIPLGRFYHRGAGIVKYRVRQTEQRKPHQQNRQGQQPPFILTDLFKYPFHLLFIPEQSARTNFRSLYVY
jgi:hypothetical protein